MTMTKERPARKSRRTSKPQRNGVGLPSDKCRPVGRVVRAVEELPPTGSVRADEVLTLPELLRRLGIGRKTLRSWRDAGLAVTRASRGVYVVGADLIEFMRSRGRKQSAAAKK